MGYIEFEVASGAGLLRFSGPKSLNALSSDAIEESLKFFEGLAKRATPDAERDMCALVLTGTGKAFIAGADLGEMVKMGPLEAKEFSDKGSKLMAEIERFPLPVIVAMNGYALGGGLELALAADFIYASSDARVGFPEVTLGLLPGFGGITRLSRRIGFSKAKELIFTGRVLDARAALDAGVIDQVFSPSELMPAVMETVAAIASAGRWAVRGAKELAGRLIQHDSSHFVHEAESFGALFSRDEPIEGMKAFLEKRKPNWK
jgi:enoyl-CoA hydratase